MISKLFRFHSRGGVQFVMKKGQRVRGTHLGLTYLTGTGRKASRVAVVVSKKVAKSAVVRNRIRRRVFEVIRREILPEVKASADMIFFVSDVKVAEMSHADLAAEICKLASVVLK